MSIKRIPLDVEGELKDYFIHSIQKVDPSLKVNEVLRLAMYRMIEMKPKELEAFLEQAKGSEALFSVMKVQIAKCISEGVLPPQYVMGEHDDLKLAAILLGLRVTNPPVEKMKQAVSQFLDDEHKGEK
jgi:hypothetical protein